MDASKKKRGNLPPGPGPGRPKGLPNKVTTEFKETIQKLLDENRDNVSLWLTQVAESDPGRALDLIAKLADFAAPRLARTEVKAELKSAPSFNLILGGG